MNFILKYLVLIILPYQCITIYRIRHELIDELDLDFEEFVPVGNHCVILIPAVGGHMPIPYQINASGAAIIHPDTDGNLYVTHGESFQFSCSGSTFASPAACAVQTEVTVKCLKGTMVGYGGEVYGFEEFRCKAMPKARLTAANASCNGVANGVFNVGFHTKAPLTLYKVCFDAAIKRTLYSWTYANLPAFTSIQMTPTEPRFVESEHFRSVDMVDVYNLKAPNKWAALEGPSMTENRILIKSLGHSLVPGQLLFRNQYIYLFQQFATYFYENTAPLWFEFSKKIWYEVERLVLQNMNKATGKHLIITGTIDSTHLNTSRTHHIPKPFVLQWPDSIPVPLSIWTMVYDVRNGTGIVYIALNTPFREGDYTKHICRRMPCPGRFRRQILGKEVVYCCDKESFEVAYGPLDPVVFKEF